MSMVLKLLAEIVKIRLGLSSLTIRMRLLVLTEGHDVDASASMVMGLPCRLGKRRKECWEWDSEL